ncbi:MAG: GH1 family beta-glucosidase [Sediminispirochaetaceae bacterium]
MKKQPQFPENFIFGAATASYQIEGAVDEGGRGPSVWDTFSHTPGKIKPGHNGDVACDHYHKFDEDIEIMDSLGVDAYRFSVSWPRLIPEGDGGVNEKGVDFYSRLVDSLLEHNISPWVTMFHWDLPQNLQDRFGGFSSPEIGDRFADYAELLVSRLGDRVKNWITLNEPWVYAVLGNLLGVHAPGKKSYRAAFSTAHNQLVAHGKAVQRLRGIDPEARVGITLNLMPVYPETDKTKDRRAANLADQFLNRLFLDPLFKGEYPEELWKKIALFRPKIEAGEMDLIGEKLDFLGINTYTREWARRSLKTPPLFFDMTGMKGAEKDFVKDGVQYTSMGWEVFPEGMHQTLLRIKNEYGNIPVYITENGAAFEDTPVPEGEGDVYGGERAVSPEEKMLRVHDKKRISYLEEYTAKVAQAIDEGAEVRGYFVWSLLDNFEWAEGYNKRFGIVYVDYETQRRIIKDSGYWYRGFIKACR